MTAPYYGRALDLVTANLTSASGIDEIHADSRLADLDLDSLVRIELAVVLAESFDVLIGAQEIESAETVHDICTLVVAKAASGSVRAGT